MNKGFIVFTPTYNRSKTLQRVYESLKKQTYKGFKWLIIDDGSTDNTKDIVEVFIKENVLAIEYHYKANGRKYSAMRLAFQLADSKYLLAIDDDDELTPDAVETFKNEWDRIVHAGLEDQFAEVAGLTYYSDGSLYGNFYFPKDVQYIDSSWHEMVLKKSNYNEHVVCWNLDKLKECVRIPEKAWLSDKINWLSEGIFWAQISRKYKTRYINKCLRIYYTDGGISPLRMSDSNKHLYNNMVSHKYLLDENLSYFFWNPKFFSNLVLKFIVSGIALKKSPLELIKVMETFRFKLTYIVLFPVGILAFLYFKFIKGSFWF